VLQKEQEEEEEKYKETKANFESAMV